MTAAVAVLAWIAAFYRLHVFRRRFDFINGAYLCSISLAGAAVTVKAAEPSIDAEAGPYVGDLVKHLLVVAMGVAVQLYLGAIEVGPRATRQKWVASALASIVAASMVASFLAAPIHFGDGHIDLDLAYADSGWVQLYRLAFNVYLAYVLVDIVRLCRRYSSIGGDEGRSTNLRLIGWGSATALLYSGSRLISLSAAAWTGKALPAVEAAGSAAVMVAVAVVAVGVASPRVVPWLRDRRAANAGVPRLERLWQDLTEAFPPVVLAPAHPSRAARRPEFVFDRRLVEISEVLRLVQLPLFSADAVRRSPNPLRELGQELWRQREYWSTGTGPNAAALMPITDRAGEPLALLALADAYAAAGAREHSAVDSRQVRA